LIEINLLQHNLIFLRKYKNSSREEFSKLLNITAAQLYTYEQRGTVPKTKVLEQLAKHVGISLDALLTVRMSRKFLEEWPHDKKRQEDFIKLHQAKTKEKYNLLDADPILSQIEEGKSKVDHAIGEETSDPSEKNLLPLLIELIKRQNTILERQTKNVEEKVETIDSNLRGAFGRLDSLKLELHSGKTIVLQSLARLEKKPVNSLLKEADSIVQSYLAEQNEQQSKTAGKGK
jgi:transcriptional regulator with XRE-family HTH domain